MAAPMPPTADAFDIEDYRARKAARPMAEKAAAVLPDIIKALLPYSIEGEDPAIIAIRLDTVTIITAQLALLVKASQVAS